MGKKHDSQYANFGWLPYLDKSHKFIVEPFKATLPFLKFRQIQFIKALICNNYKTSCILKKDSMLCHYRPMMIFRCLNLHHL